MNCPAFVLNMRKFWTSVNNIYLPIKGGRFRWSRYGHRGRGD